MLGWVRTQTHSSPGRLPSQFEMIPGGSTLFIITIDSRVGPLIQVIKALMILGLYQTEESERKREQQWDPHS